MDSILVCSLLRNNIGEDGAKAILDVAQGKSQLTTLCGIKFDQTKADFSYNGLKVGEAMLLAYDLKRNSVLVELKCVCLSCFYRQHPLIHPFDSRLQPP